MCVCNCVYVYTPTWYCRFAHTSAYSAFTVCVHLLSINLFINYLIYLFNLSLCVLPGPLYLYAQSLKNRL